MTPEDVAETIVFAAGRRENVVIAESLLFPNHQVRLAKVTWSPKQQPEPEWLMARHLGLGGGTSLTPQEHVDSVNKGFLRNCHDLSWGVSSSGDAFSLLIL